jgi:hypothetical protein
LNDDQLFLPRLVKCEGRSRSRVKSGVGALDCELDVLWGKVAPADDDEVLQAAGDENLTMVQEPKIPGTQESRFGGTVEAGAEGVATLIRPVPISLGDTLARYPQLAYPILAAW